LEEIGLMTGCRRGLEAMAIVMLVVAAVAAADVKVDLTREQVGRPPQTFEPMVRTWLVAQDAWHELRMTVNEADVQAWLVGQPALKYTLGSEPGPGRSGAPPNPDLFPANNAVLRPPVSGRIGLWAKTDSTSYFKDYEVITR
jgi:hypothetical protein